jgi:ribonuclease I
MNKYAVIFSVLGCLLEMHGPVALAAPAPGDFDSYVLAMSDENDFCAANPNKQECLSGAGALGMRLHGLWPDQHNDLQNRYQYCSDVTASQVSANWCASDIDISSSMDANVLAQLTTVMPGVDSCLENHEWYAHGTCSGMQPNDYFGLATTMGSAFIQLPNFAAFISQGSGQTVSKQQILSALEADFGSQQIDSAVVLLCRRDDQGQDHFQEVDIDLNLQNLNSFPSATSLGTAKTAGNCPDDGIVLTAASQ